MIPGCIVIGASAGGYHVVVDIISQLPANLPVPVFVVIHIPASEPSYLPAILSKAGRLPAINPLDGAIIEPGYIYVAPPDHHILISDGRIAVKRGPKENGFRPSIDALFRSAAYAYGPGAIGVVLSGALNDGTSGLWSIKRLGGTAIVQDPYEAEYTSMPRSALEYVEADYSLPSTEIGALLARLANEQLTQEVMMGNDIENDLRKRIGREVQLASGTNISPKNVLELGELSAFTCPECHGSLVKITEGKFSRFRCHTGHGFTEDALLEAVMQSIGKMIWQVTRGLQETEMLLEHIGQHSRGAGDTDRAKNFFAKAREIGKRASQFQAIALEHESLNTDNVEQGQSTN